MASVAKFDVDEGAKREIAMVRGLSALVLNGIAFAGQTFTPEMIRKLADTIRGGVMNGSVDVKDARAFFFTLGQFLERLSHAGEVCMTMERMRLGDPTSVVRVELEALPEADRVQQMEETRNLLDFTLARRAAVDLGVEELESAVAVATRPDGEGATS